MILVVGATGMVGGMIVDRLLDHGKPVRALVRSPEPAASLGARGAETVLGDLKDRSSLDRACAGVDILITTANSASRGGDDNPDTVEEQGTRNLVDAARAAGVSSRSSMPASPARRRTRSLRFCVPCRAVLAADPLPRTTPRF